MNESQLNELLQKSTLIKCECGHGLFDTATALRKVSKFHVTPMAPNDLFIPVQVMYCRSCGTLNLDYLPPGLNNLETELSADA